jgi:protease-4
MEENTPPLPPEPPAGISPPPQTPVSNAPPVLTPTARSAAPKRGRGWMVLALVLLCLLGLSLLMNLGQLASQFMSAPTGRYMRVAGPRIDEILIEDKEGSDKIGVIDIDGIITSQAIDPGGFSIVDVVRAELREAGDDHRVKAVILRIDSPGGEVLASDELNRAIVEFQKETAKPVITSMGSVAASGGYYVAVGSRWIMANELTITGSIGVIMHSWNYRGLMNKVGLRPEVYKSGKFKDMLSGEREPEDVLPEEKKMLQSMIDQTYARFKHVVATGREQSKARNKDSGRTLTEDWADYADGRVLTGAEALKLGFVDELGNFDDAVKRAEKLAGISEADIVRFQQRYDLADFFRLFGKSETRVMKVDLGMDAPKLQAGRLYYLAPSFLR